MNFLYLGCEYIVPKWINESLTLSLGKIPIRPFRFSDIWRSRFVQLLSMLFEQLIFLLNTCRREFFNFLSVLTNKQTVFRREKLNPI